MAIMTKKIDGFSLDNILQIFSLEKKSQTLEIRKEDNNGLLDIHQGELINAQLDRLNGIDAAVEILTWEGVQVEILPLRQVERTITNTVINILLEVSKVKDERKSSFDQSGAGLLISAIEKAEMQQYKESHGDIVQYLKINKNNPEGWIWYSRIQGNVEIMRKALNMANGLDANNEMVKEELLKFNAVAAQLTEQVVRKCYFCWAPLNKNTTTCPYCQGCLTISKGTLTQRSEGKIRYFDQARERYSRILKKFPRSLIALYCLGLLSVNTKKYQEALGYLDRAAKIAPEKLLFANQLKLLLDHLAWESSCDAWMEDNVQAAVAVAIEEPRVSTQKVILVVEDSSTTRKVIAITLSRQGYRVVEAADGLEALSKVSEERPDLIMLDVILPKMDGYKILSIIKGNKEFKDIPVIMLTSKDGFISKMKGKMAGSSAYLTKPFDPDKMIAEIKKHI